MRILGRADDQTVVADFDLAHGDDPARALARRGWQVQRPVAATQGERGVELTLLVRPADPVSEGHRTTHREAGVPADAVPLVKQRIAAYAVITSTRGLLATEFSHLTGAPGQWGLPGGGIEDGEEPTQAAVREVREESGQDVQLGELIRVQSQHWIGTNPHGVVEDYHAVRLIYRGRCRTPADPVVLDVGGTTSAARWVPLGDWGRLGWTVGWRALLEELAPFAVG